MGSGVADSPPTISRLAQKIRLCPWYELPDDVLDRSVHSMLSVSELKMLLWSAEHISLEQGCIVDAGCFLGGSTMALCRGLARNRAVGDKQKKIVVYDMFITPNEGYSLNAIGRGRRPGDSVRDLFDLNLVNYAPFLDVREGDFLQQYGPSDAVHLCFVDIAKTWEVNDHIVKILFGKLVPGTSILIQQDYNDHSCPWVNLTMARFADHFDYLCDVAGSRVYSYKSAIPSERLSVSLRAEQDPGQLMQLMEEEAANSGNELSHFFNLCTAAWLIFELEGYKAAKAHLRRIAPSQPWTSDEPYAELVLRSIEHVGTVENLRRYERNYFSSA
jgi:hypothetical protein